MFVFWLNTLKDAEIIQMVHILEFSTLSRTNLQAITLSYSESCYFLDRLVLLGNHRDAWVFGGIDPSSGTACMMEIAKALGQKFKQGSSNKFACSCADLLSQTGRSLQQQGINEI